MMGQAVDVGALTADEAIAVAKQIHRSNPRYVPEKLVVVHRKPMCRHRAHLGRLRCGHFGRPEPDHFSRPLTGRQSRTHSSPSGAQTRTSRPASSSTSKQHESVCVPRACDTRRVPAAIEMLDLAESVRDALERRVVNNRAELARLHGFSRASLRPGRCARAQSIAKPFFRGFVIT